VNNLRQWYQSVLRSPVLWGGLGALGFYGLIHGGPLQTPLLLRYFAGHPVEYMETAIFAIGLAALVMKALDVAAQHAALRQSPLGRSEVVTGSGLALKQYCDSLLRRLDELPAGRQREYYIGRLRAALERVRLRGSTENLDDYLDYLADLDSARQHASFALFRVIVWSIPILGFLGTVVGITMALNSVDLRAPDESMVEVLSGLGLKFDTTALALSLSIVLMFVQFFVEKAESSLLDRVTRQVAEEILSRFPPTAAASDPALASAARLTDTLAALTENLLRRQMELWQAALGSALGNYRQAMESASARLQSALAQQADVLRQVVQASGEVVRLEDALNRNLAALAGSRHFEQTVLNLAAAVQLLNARLSELPQAVRLEPARRATHAA